MSEPEVPISCAFLWGIFLEARASSASLIPFAGLLHPERIATMFPEIAGKDLKIQEVQQKHIVMMVGHILSSSLPPAEAIESLRSALESFRFSGNEKVFGLELAGDLGILSHLLTPVPETDSTFNQARIEDIKGAVRIVQDKSSDVGQVLQQLRRHKKLGAAVIDNANALVNDMEKTLGVTKALSDMEAKLQKYIAWDFWRNTCPALVMEVTREYFSVSKNILQEKSEGLVPKCTQVGGLLTGAHFQLVGYLLAAWTRQFGDAENVPRSILMPAEPDGAFDCNLARTWCSDILKEGRFESAPQVKFGIEKLSAWFELAPVLQAARTDLSQVSPTDCNRLLELADFNPFRACEAALKGVDHVKAKMISWIGIDAVQAKYQKDLLSQGRGPSSSPPPLPHPPPPPPPSLLLIDNFSLSHHQAWFSGGPGVSLEASSQFMILKLRISNSFKDRGRSVFKIGLSP